MRLLKVNGERVDLGSNTALGVTYQSGDLSKPDTKKLTVTNKFTVPMTANNKRIFEFAEAVSSSSTFPYEVNTAEYWDGNVKLITDAKIVIESTGDNYQVALLENGNVAADLKDYKIIDFIKTYYLLEPPITDLLIQPFADLIYNGANGLSFNVWSFNYDAKKSTTTPYIDMANIFGLKISKIFEWIETFTGYTIINAGTITDDALFNDMSIPAYTLQPYNNFDGSGYNVVHIDDPQLDFIYDNHEEYADYMPDRGYEYYGKKSVMDLVSTIAKVFCCIIEINKLDLTIRLVPFNTIVASTTPVDWSGKVIKKEKSFKVWDYGVESRVNYDLDDKVSEGFGSAIFLSNNQNLASLKQYSVGAVVGNSYFVEANSPGVNISAMPSIGGNRSVNNNASAGGINTAHTKKPLDGFRLMVDTGATYTGAQTFIYKKNAGGDPVPPDVDTFRTTGDLATVVAVLDLTAGYTGVAGLVLNPVSYKAEMNLKRLDIHTFSFENVYRIDELGGIFYVNKIPGYNSLSKKGTKVELIKI